MIGKERRGWSQKKAELSQVPKKDWVPYLSLSLSLLAALPAELSNMLAQEPTEKANNYDFVKDFILKRYRLNREKLKQCFYRHKKSAEKSWRNYAHELNCYFTERIADLQVKTLEQLKDLFTTEQLKSTVFPLNGSRLKETSKDFMSKFQIKKKPAHEKNHEKDLEKRRQLRCYECRSYSRLRPQCDKL
ncbi:SCAN box domain-containing protein [Trichonephila clavipes]|nr:SCAN box domain-containing protein [Trichonephila clavipes]